MTQNRKCSKSRHELKTNGRGIMADENTTENEAETLAAEEAAVEAAANRTATPEGAGEQASEEAPRTLTDFAELAALQPARPHRTGLAEATSQPIDDRGRSYATDVVKTRSRAWIKPGPGKMVNGRTETYFARPTQQMMIKQPFEIAGRANQYDVIAR